jgi:hypothetical protein
VGKQGEPEDLSREAQMTSSSETGQVTGTKDKDYDIIWFTEACLSNALRLETYIQDAEREGDTELAATFFRKTRPRAARAPSRASSCCASGWGADRSCGLVTGTVSRARPRVARAVRSRSAGPAMQTGQMVAVMAATHSSGRPAARRLVVGGGQTHRPGVPD